VARSMTAMNRHETNIRGIEGTAPSRGGRIGVLIVNLGTPDATDPPSVRRYLREFLSDARVIENQGLIWKFVLNAIILPRRPKTKGRDYERIWNRERDESPLKTITRSQAAKLRPFVDAADPSIIVDWGMRYGNPSMESRIEALAKAGCERILLLPLYPQYAAATSATVCDMAFLTLIKLRDQPALRVVPPYYDDPVYIEALAGSIEASLKILSFTPELILASFHGIPKSYVDEGDPYPLHCGETVRLLRTRRINLPRPNPRRTFKSPPPTTACPAKDRFAGMIGFANFGRNAAVRGRRASSATKTPWCCSAIRSPKAGVKISAPGFPA